MAASMALGPREHGNSRLSSQLPAWNPEDQCVISGVGLWYGKAAVLSCDCAAGTYGVKVYYVQLPRRGGRGVSLLELPV